MSANRAESMLSLEALPEWLEVVRSQVASLRYGTVEIIVHDSQVTQIEKTERVRLDKPQPKNKK
ncbi:MAG: YezD family protein [Verrucomicrobiae bacterium]